MATLQELHDLFGDQVLTIKVKSALLVACYNLVTGTPTAQDRAYAAKVFRDPQPEAERVLKYVLAANADQLPADILAATDLAVQNQVNQAVPIMVLADAGA